MKNLPARLLLGLPAFEFGEDAVECLAVGGAEGFVAHVDQASNGCNLQPPQTGGANTGANGQYGDDYFLKNAPACPSSCRSTATQTVKVSGTTVGTISVSWDAKMSFSTHRFKQPMHCHNIRRLAPWGAPIHVHHGIALRIAVVLALLTCGPAGSLWAQERSTCVTEGEASVPHFVLAAVTTGTVADVASALSEAGVCAGILVGEDARGEMTRSWRDEARLPAVPLEQVLEALGRREPKLDVQKTARRLLIRDTRLPLDIPALTCTVGPLEFESVRAGEAYRRVVDSVAPGKAPAGGLVGSSPSSPGDPPLTRDDIEGPAVSARYVGSNLIEILADLGEKSPGIVWTLSATTPSDLRKTSYELRLFMRRGRQRSIGSAFQVQAGR